MNNNKSKLIKEMLQSGRSINEIRELLQRMALMRLNALSDNPDIQRAQSIKGK